MSNYLVGYFSRRQVFHIVAYRDSQEEVDAFLKIHNRRGLVVYAAQQERAADGAKVNTCGCKDGAKGIHANFCLFYKSPRR